MSNFNALELVFLRNHFYRRQYFLALALFLLNIVVIAVLIGVLIFLKRNPTRPVYFATDNVGRLIKVVPVNQPNMKLEEVMAWAQTAVENIYSYDFINYQSQMQFSQRYFQIYGWENYIQALTASNNLIALKERRMVVVAKVVDRPTVIAQGILAGAYAYKFTMPMLVTYMLPPYDEKSQFSNALTVTMVIQRQPILQSDHGLGIVQLLAEVATSHSGPAQLEDVPT